MAVQMPPDWKEAILHSSLISGDISIVASDLNRNERIKGNTVLLCIDCNTEEELNTFFTKLSRDGKVTGVITNMPWGAKYGEHWVFNYNY